MSCDDWTKGASKDPLVEIFNPEIPRDDSKLKPSSSSANTNAVLLSASTVLPKVEEQKVE